MPNEQQKLYEATNRLARYFGLYTARDLAGRIALEQLQGIVGANSTTANFDLPPPPQEITDLVAAIIDTSEGAYLLHDLVTRINNTMTTPTTAEGSDSAAPVTGDGAGGLQDRINRFIQIIGPEGITLDGAANTTDSINDILANNHFINSNPNNPDKDTSPHLSVIKVNNVRITPTGRNINAITIFLNGIPTIELAKAVPILNIQLLLPGSPISQNGRLENLSLFRFLEGNVQVDATSTDNVRSTLALANKVRNAGFLEGQEPTEQNTTYTQTGMEIFTSPQTLVNGNEFYNNPDRVNPILDKFQPLLTLKELSIDIAPSTGLMSFKTARLNFILHDRSRLAEIANLIRPDLYARTELMIEYGWNHPEANIQSEGINNYYAELINALRCREKYGIVNSSLSFQDGGLVDITLELAMRGGSDASSETISTNEMGNVNQVLTQIRELSETVGTYRRRIFGQETGPSSTEVRGIQILDVAEDARNNLILNRELQDQLRQFRRTLGHSSGHSSEAATGLTNALDQLFGSATESTTGGGGLVGGLRSTVTTAILGKMRNLANTPDPFAPTTDSLQDNPSRPRHGSLITQRRDSRGHVDRTTAATLDRDLQGVPLDISLAKLLILFVGEPLAMTRKFDDIQFIFYPFNGGAAFARNLNIGSFSVDTRFFYENYLRLRLENLSRSSNMNLQDFLQFIATTVIDDNSARSYGLFSPGRNGAMFRRVSTDGGGSTTEAAVDPVELQSRIETLLTNVTPDATFRMPQVDFYLECLPQRIDREGDVADSGILKTILRIHVFDRHTTAYETQGALIASARQEEIRNISSIPNLSGGDTGVIESQVQAANEIINAASSAGLIEKIEDPSSQSAMFQLRGGTPVLKEFLRRTMPYIIYGAQGTTIKQANLTSIQDPALSTVNMLRSYQTSQLDANGEQPGGLPLQIIPCELSLTTFGCPFVDFAQQFFIDFQTGTSIDNIYGVVGISHRISAGEFTTEVRLAPLDAYGTYRSLTQRIHNASVVLSQVARTATAEDQASGAAVTSGL